MYAARKGPLFYITEQKRLAELAEQRKQEAIQRAIEANLIREQVAKASQPKPVQVVHFHQSVNRKRKINEIVSIVAQYFGVCEMELLGERRTKNVIEARHTLYWLCRELTPYSLPEIGRRLDGRDHTTILHGIRKIDSMIASGHDIADKCYALRKMWEPTPPNCYWGA